MSLASTYAKDAIIKYLTRGTPALPSTWYFGLHTISAETNYVDYARVGVVANTSNFTASAAGILVNTNIITFPTVGTSGDTNGNINQVYLYDALTGGNSWTFAWLTSGRSTSSGDILTIGAGSLHFFFN